LNKRLIEGDELPMRIEFEVLGESHTIRRASSVTGLQTGRWQPAMSENQSVTGWIESLKEGDEAAAQSLWQRYFQRLAGLARQRLGAGQRRVQDEDDIAISVFKSLCERAERGDLAGLEGRDDLWRLLATITLRKVAGQVRDASRQKRGGGLVRGDSVFSEEGGLDAVASTEPTPDFLHQLAEEQHRLLEALADETLRRIALWKMEGWTGDEIAGKLGITRRSVERKVERIRELWKGELRP
jgi:DNA-directed RNA polymerase specialized sigma24 family protein